LEVKPFDNPTNANQKGSVQSLAGKIKRADRMISLKIKYSDDQRREFVCGLTDIQSTAHFCLL